MKLLLMMMAAFCLNAVDGIGIPSWIKLSEDRYVNAKLTDGTFAQIKIPTENKKSPVRRSNVGSDDALLEVKRRNGNAQNLQNAAYETGNARVTLPQVDNISNRTSDIYNQIRKGNNVLLSLSKTNFLRCT
jgi:hypothetical protein